MLFIRGMVDIISFSELQKSRWMLNRTFHLSPHENICTIALITIHYLYTICSGTQADACNFCGFCLSIINRM